MIRHLITSEYPPQTGGVSDYTRIVAEGLASGGEEIHVWCPNLKCADLAPLANGGAQLGCSRAAEGQSGVKPPHSKVFEHREFGGFRSADLRCVGSQLDQFPAPRRVLVQWVPHGYGYRSMNLRFCLWLWRRAWRGDQIEIMVHEPYLSFGEGSWKQNLVAVVHRLMTIVLLRAVRRVWIAIPAWESCWRPYALGRPIEFNWLPVVSNIPIVDTSDYSQQIRSRYLGNREVLVGHFGSYDRNGARLLSNSLPELVKNGTKISLLLLGHGSLRMRSELLRNQPSLASHIYATGSLDAHDLSRHISACDVMLQPYIDGVSSRRGSTMVALAHGVPVVTTKGRLTESLWAESDAVALAPPEDVAELVRLTQRLLPDATARQRLTAAAKKLYEERFHPRRTIDALREGMES